MASESVTEFDPRLWARLSESGRRALVQQAVMLAQGFTGRIEIDCNQGGVTGFVEVGRILLTGRDWAPKP